MANDRPGTNERASAGAEGDEAMREAFIAGWWANAVTPEDDDTGSQEYLDEYAEVDWQAYRATLHAPRDGQAAEVPASEMRLYDELCRVREALEGLVSLQERTDMTEEDAYDAMFKSGGAAEWKAAREALAPKEPGK